MTWYISGKLWLKTVSTTDHVTMAGEAVSNQVIKLCWCKVVLVHSRSERLKTTWRSKSLNRCDHSKKYLLVNENICQHIRESIYPNELNPSDISKGHMMLIFTYFPRLFQFLKYQHNGYSSADNSIIPRSYRVRRRILIPNYSRQAKTQNPKYILPHMRYHPTTTTRLGTL